MISSDTEMRNNADERRTGLRLVILFAAGFTISQFLRNSTGILMPVLAEEMTVEPRDAGLLAGGFFASFAFFMIPTGILLDRFGARIVMAVYMLIIATGCALFALAENVALLIVARIIMGCGCAALLMGPLSVISRWFAPALFSTLTAIIMATGNLGSLISTAPLEFAVDTFGWRTVFAALSGLCVVVAGLYALRVRDAPAAHEFHSRHRETFSQALTGVGEACLVPGLVPVFVMQFVFYAVVAALLGIWAPAYLSVVHGLESKLIGEFMLLMTGALVVGMLVLGPSDRVFGTRKWIVVASAAVMAGGLIVLTLFPAITLTGAVASLCAIAFFGGASTVLLAHGKSLFANRLVGRGLTVVNTAVMGGVFIMQAASGWLAQTIFHDAGSINNLPNSAFQVIFAFIAMSLIAGLLIYLWAKDVAP